MRSRPHHDHRPSTTPDAPGLAVRRAAALAIHDVLEEGAPLEDALRGDRLDPRDLALARMIAATTMRRFGSIGAILDSILTKGLPDGATGVEAILATAAAQILFLDVPDHAAVDLAVRLAREDRTTVGFSGLINAVLRKLSLEKATHLAAIAADADAPRWMARRWRVAYGERAEAIIAAHRNEPPLDLTAKGDPVALAQALGGTLLPTGSVRLFHAGSVSALPGYEAGDWWVQDAAAALPAKLLGTVSGKRVLDMCAAPGGKTAQLVAAGAIVTALDRSDERIDRMDANLKRLKLSATAVAADALSYQAEPFDAVLLDAPCSATGTMRRHPDIAWTKAEGDIRKLSALQDKLIDNAARLLRSRGTLIYCTCSLEPEEGEARAEAFLARNLAFAREPVRPDEVGGLAAAITKLGDLRTLPSMLPVEGGMDGFFAARFVRK